MTPVADLGRILDSGLAGLTFFTRYLPFAHLLGAAGSATVETLRERYDEQRDLDLTPLTVDAADLARLTESLTVCLDDQHVHANGLHRVWEGRTADAARCALGVSVARGSVLVRAVEAVARALDTAAADIAVAVGDKARVVGDFADRAVDGRTPGEVEAILAGASGGSGGPTPEQALRWFGTGDDGSRNRDAIDAAHVPEECTRWLHETFVPEIAAAVETVVGVCDDTDRAINDVFDSVATVFDLIDDHGPDAAVPVGDRRSTGDGATPQSSTGDGTTPQWATVPTSSIPDHAARLTEAGVDLAVAAGGLATAVLDLASAALGAATVAVETAVERSALPDVPPDVESPEAGRSGAGSTEGGSSEAGSSEEGSSESESEARADVPGPVPSSEDGATAGESRLPGEGREEVDRPNPQETGVTPAVVPPGQQRRDTSTRPPQGPTGPVVQEAGATEGSATDEHREPSGGAVLAEAGPL